MKYIPSKSLVSQWVAQVTFTLSVSLAATLSLGNLSLVNAQVVPSYWPYQGFIMDQSGEPITGSVELSVSIYAELLSSTPLWRGTLSGVNVARGAFAVDLGEMGGDVIAGVIRSGEARYIGVSVNGGVELSPRTRLGAVPYATLASDTLTLAGRTPDEFVTVVSLEETLAAELPNLDALNTELATVRGIAEVAQVAADNAQDAAGTAQTTADTAQATADTAQTAAGTAQTTADTAQTTAGTAQTTADTARGTADAAQDLAQVNASEIITATAERVTIRDLALNALDEDESRTLIESYGYITSAAVTVLLTQLLENETIAEQLTLLINQVIDERGYLNTSAVTFLINQNIDARGYLDTASATTLINQLISNRGYLSAEATAVLINQVIDGRGYITEARALEIADERATLLVSDSETRLSQTITALTTRIEALEASQETQTERLGNLEVSQGAQDGLITDLSGRITTAQETADAAAVAASQGQASPPFILGVSDRNDNGLFEFTDSGGTAYQGVRAAGESCKATYPNDAGAHFCSLSEVQAALSIGNYNPTIDNIDTWVFPSWSKANGGFAGDADFCQSLLYNSAHAAVGTSVAILTATSSSSSGSGSRLSFNDNKLCSHTLPVLCCR